jgi:molybdopterin-guanine dinucleotide biosynthesis protein A
MAALMGVILCGGESRRMGRDKGLIQKDGISWARRMADKLVSLGLPVVFSVNTSQLDAYTQVLPGEILVADSAAADGPLKGLLSVHEKFPDEDLLLLGCDMLDMDAQTIQLLTDAHRKDVYSFYAYAIDGFFEPLCCIYTAAGLAAGPMASSLQNLLRQGKTKSLVMVNNEAFRNYNTL